VTTIEQVRALIRQDHGLATVSVARADGSVHSSVVNVGVLAHPVSGAEVVGMVVRANAVKLARWRVEPRATVIVRAAWRWVGVEGAVSLLGPLDPLPGVDQAALPGVLRDVFIAAGGTHDDWDEYDRVMALEQRTAVFVVPHRILGSS
jgi:hypothetical protein